jgi:uncharacterized protein (TIGR03663 family)
VPTASTKRRGNKKSNTARAAKATKAQTKPAPDVSAPERFDAPDIPERVWRGASVAVLAVAAFLRLYALEINPLHHDEGVNGWFLTRLLREGFYHYDPQNYHGPTLYYITLVPAFILEKILGVGMSTFMLRAVTSLFGIGIVWLALRLRRQLGTTGALAAAALIAVSPGAVYQSRYFIHETPFVFFTFAIVVAALRYYETARTTYLMLAFASAAMLFATKETAFISLAVLGLAWGVARGWEELTRRFGWMRAEEGKTDARKRSYGAQEGESGGLARFGSASHAAMLLAGGIGLFVLINLLFYSSFFTYPEGVKASIETFKVWSKTASKDHTKPFDTYLTWLEQEEAAIYVLGVLGAVWALARLRNRFAVFAGAWAFGLLAAYSIVKYKTPWLSLNFIVPMALVAGYALDELYGWAASATERWRTLTVTLVCAAVTFIGVFVYTKVPAQYFEAEAEARRRILLYEIVFSALVLAGFGAVLAYRQRETSLRRRALILFLAALAVGVGTYQSVALNFYHYDDDRYPYVYAHTTRGFLQMFEEIERLARRAGTGKETPIAFLTPDYWPVPWYFRDYKRLGYPSTPQAFTDPIVVASEAQNAQLQTFIGATHTRVGDFYALRPGVNLVLYARRDLVRP